MKYILAHDIARQRAMQAVKDAPAGMVVTIEEPKRNLEQNALMWVLLGEIAEQVEWFGQHLAAEEWKAILTAHLRGQRMVPGIGGGFVVLGDSTRKMSKREFSDLIELIYSFGAEKGVKFSEVAA